MIAQYGVAQEGERGGGGGRGAGRGGGRGAGRGPVEPPPPPKPGFECFDHAETPEFPSAALQQHVDGTVWVTLDVTAQGTPDKIHSEISTAWTAGEKLLVPAVEKAVRASKFKSSNALKQERGGGVSLQPHRRHAVAHPDVTTKSDARIMYIDSAPELAAAGGKRAAK